MQDRVTISTDRIRVLITRAEVLAENIRATHLDSQHLKDAATFVLTDLSLKIDLLKEALHFSDDVANNQLQDLVGDTVQETLTIINKFSPQ